MDIRKRFGIILAMVIFSLSAIVLFSGLVVSAQNAAPQIAKPPLTQMCSSYGSYPMSASPSTSEFCETYEYGPVMWSATMTSNTNMVVAYWGINGKNGNNPLYVANSLIVPNSLRIVCAPNKTPAPNVQCLFIDYGISGHTNGNYWVMTEITGYQVNAAITPYQ